MKNVRKVLAVLAAAAMTLGILAGCTQSTEESAATDAKAPTTADYAGTYLFDQMITKVDGKTTEVAVGDKIEGKTIDEGYAVSTLNADGTCTLDMQANPGKPMEGIWVVKSADTIEITTEGQTSEVTIDGDTLTTPSTFDVDGKKMEMTFVFKKASSTTRADYAGEYHIQKIAVEKDGKTEEYALGDDYQGTILTEDSEISFLNSDGTCSLKSDINDMAIPDGTWRVAGDGEIIISVDMGEGSSGSTDGPVFTIKDGVFTQVLEYGDGETSTFTYIKK